MEKNAEKTDRRVIKTKKAIHKAMAQLIAEKDINDITVKEISDLADINRKTFYNYYSGIYQLVDEMEDRVVEYFAGLIKKTDFEKALADPSIVFDMLYETIREHVDFIDALFADGRNASLMHKVISKLIEMTSDAAAETFHVDPAKAEIIVRFIFAGEIAVYQNWYHSDRQIPIKDVSKSLGVLCTKGIDSLLEEQTK